MLYTDKNLLNLNTTIILKELRSILLKDRILDVSFKRDSKVSHYFRDKPTIGILPGWSSGSFDLYLRTVIRGMQSAARSLNCNLLLAWGVGRVVGESSFHPAWPVASLDSDFVPVGPWNTDGIIIFAPLMNEERSLYIQKIANGGHPVLYIAKGEKGPAIFADSEGGICLAIDHLAEHGHRQIAFIAGTPNDPGDSAIRYKSYCASLNRLGLEINPKLIAIFEVYCACSRIQNK